MTTYCSTYPPWLTGVVAVDQDRLCLEAAVVVVASQLIMNDGPEYDASVVEVRLAVGGPHVIDVGASDVAQVLAGDVALEDGLEEGRQPEVDVEEVRHVGDVVDLDLAAINTLNQDRVPAPVGRLVTGELRDLRDGDLWWRRVALDVVPDQQLTVHLGGPGAGAGHPGVHLA